MYLTARRAADELSLQLSGQWHALRFADIEAELGRLDMAGLRQLNIAAAQAQLDLTGAWLLRDFLDRARAAGVAVQIQGNEPSALALVERCRTRAQTIHTHSPAALPP